jgi:hypothetical protein
MENIPKNFSSRFIQNFQIHENLAEQIRDQLKKEEIGRILPKAHFNLTELCNLQASYWKRKKPNIKQSNKLKLILRRGTKLHNFSNRWFRELSNFSGHEITLDGCDVGIPGIIGRLDFKIGDSIVEFKTKPEIPSNSEEVFILYPQDIEQLIFYSVMHIKNPLENYIVFMEDIEPHKLIAFKVKIKNIDPIRKLLIERKNIFEMALSSCNPSLLGKCRYHGGFCEFEIEKQCNCKNLENLQIDVIKEFVEIFYDEKMTKELTEIRKRIKIPKELFTTNEIIAPRKSFVKRVLGAELEYFKNEVQEDRKSYLHLLINKLQKNPNQQEINLIERSIKEEKLYIGKKWIKFSSSRHPEGEIIPYLVKAKLTDKKDTLSYPGQYNLSELAIICSAYGKERGLIFMIYPNLDNFIQVFNISFKDMPGCLREVKKILTQLGEIKTKEEITKLPPCPFYMNAKKNCPITKECNKIKGNGCLFY